MRTRRRFLALGSLATGSLVARASAQAAGPTIDRLGSLTITPQILKWAYGGGPQPLDLPAVAAQSYHALDENVAPPKRVGKADREIAYLTRESWEVFDANKVVVARFDAVVPFTQTVSIEVLACLLVADGANTADRDKLIVDGFNAYDLSSGTHPDTYAASLMKPPVTPDSAIVTLRYQLTCVGAATPNNKQLEAILLTYELDLNGQPLPPPPSSIRPPGLVWEHPDQEPVALDAFLKKYKYSARRISKKLELGVEEPIADGVHELTIPPQTQEQQAKRDIEAAISKVADDEMVKPRCTYQKTLQMEICRLFSYPEFRLVWDPVRIKIGCVEVVFSWPRIETRVSALELYAYVGIPKILPIDEEQAALTCARHAALAGTVAGIVFANFGAALATFTTYFTTCIAAHVSIAPECLVPGLFMVSKVTTDWG